MTEVAGKGKTITSKIQPRTRNGDTEKKNRRIGWGNIFSPERVSGWNIIEKGSILTHNQCQKQFIKTVDMVTLIAAYML